MLDLTHQSCNMLVATHTCSLSPFCDVPVVLLDSHLVTFSCRTGRRMSCSSSVQPVIMKLRIPSSMHSLVSWLQPVSHLEETLIIFFPNGCYVSLMGDQLRCGFSPAGGEKPAAVIICGWSRISSSAAGRFSQTMTQSLGVAYFQPLLSGDASRRTETRGAAPETRRNLFQNKRKLFVPLILKIMFQLVFSSNDPWKEKVYIYMGTFFLFT